MESLTSLALAKIPDVTTKSLKEILDLCDDQNPERASAVCDALLSSRDALFSIFKNYLKIRKGSPNYAYIANARIMLREALLFRQDIQTPTQCEHFFKAIVRGFKWNYVIVQPLPNEDRMYFKSCAKFEHDGVGAVTHIEFDGTLPDPGTIGVMMKMTVATQNLHLDGAPVAQRTLRPKIPLLFYDPMRNVATNRNTRMILIGDIVRSSDTSIRSILDGFNFQDDLTISRLTLESDGLQNMNNQALFRRDFEVEEPNMQDVFDILTEVLMNPRSYDFTINSPIGSNGKLVITLSDAAGLGSIVITLTNTVFEI